MTAQYLEIGGFILAAFGGVEGVKAGLRWWAGYRERRARAQEDLAAAELEAQETEAEVEASTIREIFELSKQDRARLAKVELQHEVLRKHTDDCHEALAEQSSLNQLLIQSNADCEQRYVELEQRVERQEARTSDMTGRFQTAKQEAKREIKREVRKALSSPHGIPIAREGDPEPDDE